MSDLTIMQDWIENIWPCYHDSAIDEQLISYFNNINEINRLNEYRGESVPMKWFNLMLVKALYERNKHLIEREQ